MAKTYYEANRERILASVKARYTAKREEVRAYKREYQQRNKAQLAEKNREYYAANKAAISVRAKAAYAANPSPWRDRAKVYRQANPTKARAAVEAWGKANPARLAARKRVWERANYHAHPERYREIQSRRKAQKLNTTVERIDFAQILTAAAGLCGICKKPFDLFGIDFDHIVPLARGGTHTADNLQATHSRCNRSKGAKVG